MKIISKNYLLAISLSVVSALPLSTMAEETDEQRYAPLPQLFGIASPTIYDENIRADVKPSIALQRALHELQGQDKSASVTWFRGHVDSFSAAPKATVPRYAQAALKAAGIEHQTVQPKKFDTVLQKKNAVDWDENSSRPLPFPIENIASSSSQEKTASDNTEGKPDSWAKDLARPTIKPRPEAKKESKDLSRLAHQVLIAFLQKNQNLFELSDRDLENALPNLKLHQFGSGTYFHRLVYSQKAGEGILHNGKTVVVLDRNWNIIDISRILLTQEKLKDIVSEDQVPKLSRKDAIEKARELSEATFGKSEKLEVTEATLGLQAVSGEYTWKLRVKNADRYYADYILTFNAATGKLIHSQDNIDRYTDAKVSRWGFSGGDYTAPVRYTSSNFYTRDDNTLVHDFFHLVTDNRNNGSALDNCWSTPDRTDTEANAYGTTSGSNYIRPTIRNDRDFSLWWPSEVSGTFGEANTYYWARWFMQWLKPAMDDLGVLPGSASSYPRALIIANACDDGVGVHNSSFAVTTLNSVGEGTNTIRLPERCRSSNGSCSASDYSSSNSGNTYTYEGNAGYSTPGVIHHELNHFVMKRYFNIGSGLDCSAGEQLKFIHEGALGRSLPQAYWHNYYGTGYAPSNTNKNYRHNQTSGRPHKDNASLNKLSDFYCSDTDSPYNGGSVVHQAMWKFYHGIAVNGSTMSGIPRTSTDRDFVLINYWAADLVSGSTWQDRYEMANRVMQIMEQHSNLSSSGKQDWCDVWDVHELDTYINSGYCS